ncbi:hypothetical protein FOB61_004631 [Candida parapsilosis]|nr:hypothetical protein FOB61_004631 [Candida parapsilosis]
MPASSESAMETLEIHSKDFLIKWINAPQDSTIDWQVKPLKKSINFAFYQKRDDTTSSQSTGSTASVNQFKKSNDVYKSKSRTSTLSSIGQSDLSLIKNYNKLIANELVHGKFHTATGGMFAFVFDNSFSKTIAKSVEFSANVIATDISQEEKIEHNDQQVFDNNADNSLAGEVLQSIMLKNGERSCKDLLSVNAGKEAIISANPSNRQFIIDSGMEVWHLKAINQADFNAWVNAFNAIKRQESPNAAASKSPSPFRSSTELNNILHKLDQLRLENPSPLVGEIHQDI